MSTSSTSENSTRVRATTASRSSVCPGVALTRVAVMVAVRNVLRAKSSTLELLFEFGAFAYAGSVSLMAALAILHNVSVEAQMVLVVYAVGYATAIAPRNAGRPFIAIGQLLAVMAPLTGALLLSDALLVRVLGVVALLHIPSTVSITINVYRSLRTSIAEAETNERLARKMEVLRTLGVPYTDEDIAGAQEAVKGVSEMDALIAYLQHLGTVLSDR